VRHFAFIHITADRGLAGGLNSNMNRAGAALALEHQPRVERVSVVAVGRKGRDFFRRAGFPLLAEFTQLGDYPGMTQILPIARVVIEDYVAGNIDQVFIGYQRFVNTAVQRPTVRQILPVTAPEGEAPQRVDFLFEPSPEQLLETLLPRYVEMQIYEAVLDAAASEQSARMVAMRAATDAANEMVADLTLTYNKARQELITGELLDIVGGTAALEAAGG
jgi:F-type H+-transporting ATPase subunit gamma